MTSKMVPERTATKYKYPHTKAAPFPPKTPTKRFLCAI
jgi:hypothetical protein